MTGKVKAIKAWAVVRSSGANRGYMEDAYTSRAEAREAKAERCTDSCCGRLAVVPLSGVVALVPEREQGRGK